MKRINVYIEPSEFEFLKELPETLSEHVRRALRDYIIKLKTQDVSVSASKREVDNE